MIVKISSGEYEVICDSCHEKQFKTSDYKGIYNTKNDVIRHLLELKWIVLNHGIIHCPACGAENQHYIEKELADKRKMQNSMKDRVDIFLMNYDELICGVPLYNILMAYDEFIHGNKKEASGLMKNEYSNEESKKRIVKEHKKSL